jgi:cobaltochelatase CobT
VNTPQQRAPQTLEQRFERALIHSTRALAGEKGLRVLCGVAGSTLPGNPLLLPAIPTPLTPSAAARLRGQADRLALRRAHYDAVIHARFRPTGPRARELYDALEDMRCQSLGANVMSGIASNLEAALVAQLEHSGVLRAHLARHSGKVQALALLVRERLTGRPAPEIAAPLMARWRAELEARTGGQLAQLAAAAPSQEQFAVLIHELVRDFDLGNELGSEAQRQAQLATAPPGPAAGASSSKACSKRMSRPSRPNRQPNCRPTAKHCRSAQPSRPTPAIAWCARHRTTMPTIPIVTTGSIRAPTMK